MKIRIKYMAFGIIWLLNGLKSEVMHAQVIDSFKLHICIESPGPVDSSVSADSLIPLTLRILQQRLEASGCTLVRFDTTGKSGQYRVSGKSTGLFLSRIQALLTTTGNFSFRETVRFSELTSDFAEANLALQKQAESDTVFRKALLQQAKSSFAKEGGFPEFSVKNPLYAFLTLNLERNKEGQYFPGQGPLCGFVKVTDTAFMSRLLARVARYFPSEVEFAWTTKPDEKQPRLVQLIALKKIHDPDGSVIANKQIRDVQLISKNKERPVILVKMTYSGSDQWAALTRENIGYSLAMVLDRGVFSYPKVTEEISDGSATITGSFNPEEAADFAIILKFGALPVRVSLLK